jgi:hypothetical protein
MGKRTIVDTFLDAIVLLDDNKKIAATFKNFLKKAKTTDEKIELSTCYKSYLQKTSTSKPEQPPENTSISLDEAMKKREEVTESIKLFNNGKSFNIDQFNNFFENLRVNQGSQGNTEELTPVDFGDPFGNCQPIIEYGGIIVEDTPETRVVGRTEYGMFDLNNMAHGNIENFKNTRVNTSYKQSAPLAVNPVQHRNADEYVQFKKEKLQKEMEAKKQKVIEKVKSGYYQGANSALLERQLQGYNHHEMIDRLAHGAFKK